MSQQIVVYDDKMEASRRRSTRPKPNILVPMDASPSNSKAA